MRRAGASPDEVAERMRRDIRIELNDERDRRDRQSRTVAFTVAYSATHPVVASEVANTLASFYIEENGKLREKQAAGTSRFLDAQLEEARRKLAAQEQRIVAYKERHMGELPEQRDANLRTLERLQAQLQLAHESQRRAHERRAQITQTLASLDQSAAAAAPSPASANAARLALLRQELLQLETTYSDRYPDVVHTKQQIRQLEEKVAAEQAASAQPARSSGLRPVPQNPYVQNLMSQLDQANIEVKTVADQIATLNREITVYQRRIEVTPKREQELALITRDHDTTRELFRSLLGKREEAGIAADLEQRQQGETFRVMDPAVVPDRPAGPNRLRLLLIGLVLAVGASAAAVVLAENVDTSFRRVEEVRSRLPIPVLSTIPRIATEQDRRRALRQRRLAAAAMAGALLLVIGSSWVIARDNQTLVGLLTPETTAGKR
jgi:polysaccharide chain length determinant protein (PEP-CTERM system associated)